MQNVSIVLNLMVIPRIDYSQKANTGSGTYPYYDMGAYEYANFEFSCIDLDDNDGDGKIDCDDEDCYGFEFGECDTELPGICSYGIEKCINGERICKAIHASNEVCNDGIDNDCDGLIDCKDMQCNGLSCNDENVCTENDICSSNGSCVGTPLPLGTLCGESMTCDGAGKCGPDLIILSDFSIIPKSNLIIVNWSTDSEIDNAGFNIYRAESEDGTYVRLGASLIAAQGTATSGATYAYTDRDVVNRRTYFYKLEDLDITGAATLHGPVSATPLFIYRIK